MNHKYIVAQNAFTVSMPADLPAWQTLDWHFSPFETTDDDTTTPPVLAVDIIVGKLPVCAAETIYQPHFGGIGFITACASRLPDGTLILDFRHINEAAPRLSMHIPPELNKACITLTPDGDSDDAYFITHALMIAYMLATGHNGTLLIHTSAVIFDGKAYLFQGKSGTGKSTHAALWTNNIAGAELFNDDNPLIRFAPDGTAMAYGSPWSGKTHCYRNIAAPIGAFVRIVRDKHNALRRLAPLPAYASLTASVFYLPFLTDALRDTRHNTIERLVATVPCCEMHCRPDADAAITCMRALTDNTSTPKQQI